MLTRYSYGYLFRDIILTAANEARLGAIPQSPGVGSEVITDRSFSFRLADLNTDFMSYTSLALCGGNKSALLDPSTLGNISSTVFSKFFKHFVQANVTANNALSMNGTWGLQLQGGVGPSSTLHTRDSSPTTNLQEPSGPSGAISTADAVIKTKIETLDMNPAAAIICLCILSLFILTILVITICRRHYLKDLPRDVDTLGSVLGFAYGSDRLLSLVGESAGEEGKLPGTKMLKMGWFEVSQKKRWGIDVVRPGDTFLKEFIDAEKGFKEVRLSH